MTQHYPPEVTAGAFRLGAFTDGLLDRGHEVSVLCAVPNHPHGEIAEGFRWRPWVSRTHRSARLTYLWVFARPRKTAATRLAYYGSFAAAATAAGVFRRRPDVVLASSPPLPVGAVGALLARRFRVPHVFDVRDLWPESAIALGELREGRASRALEWLERRLYDGASAVVTVNEAFARHIAARTEDASKIHVVANGTTRDWLEAGHAQADRSSAGLPADEFVWAYAGNIGLAHALDVAIGAAELLGSGFRLLIIGHGPRRAELEGHAAALPAGAVEFRDVMPPAEVARHLRAADALLVSESQEKTVSAKLYDYAAIGRPIVAVARGEMLRLIEAHEIALPVAPGDPRALAAGVRRLREDGELTARLARHARAFAAEHLREAEASRLVDVLEGVGQSA